MRILNDSHQRYAREDRTPAYANALLSWGIVALLLALAVMR